MIDQTQSTTEQTQSTRDLNSREIVIATLSLVGGAVLGVAAGYFSGVLSGIGKGYEAAQVKSIDCVATNPITLKQNNGKSRTFVYNTAGTNENILGYGDMRTHIPLEEDRANKIASLELKARIETIAVSDKYKQLIEAAKH
jgi:hypothetical protein